MTIVLDEFHLTVLIPHTLRAAEITVIRRTLNQLRFRLRLGSAVRKLFREYPSLRQVRVILSR